MTERILSVPPGETIYQQAYDLALALWPVPYEILWVETEFGSTHIIDSGMKDKPVVILLHGLNISSTVWYANVASLARHFRVLAVDLIGDAGRSKATKLPKEAKDYAQLMMLVLDNLKIKKAHVIGLSYGGYVAINFALYAPDRVNKIALLAPAWLLPTRKQFLYHAFSAWKTGWRWLFDSFVASMSVRPSFVAREVTDQMYVNFRYAHRRPQVKTKAFDKQQLASIAAPTLLLVGEEEVIYDPKEAVELLTSLNPLAQAEIIADAGHLINIDQSEFVNDRIVRFLL